MIRAALCALLLSTAGPALASSQLTADTGSSHSLDSTSGPCALDLTLVDLTTEAEIDRLDSNDADSSAAPVLNLGPRVASILREVFGEPEVDIDDPREILTPAMAPLAEATAPAAEASSDEATHADVEDQPFAPVRIHREMYRTDI